MNRTVIIALACLTLAGCDSTPVSSDHVQRQAQEQLNRQGNAEVGMPGVHNFFEKRQMRRIIEMRDDSNLVTYTYVRDLGGHLHTVCRSVGFPIPGATQYTNPSRLVSEYQYPTNGTGNDVSGSTLHTVEGVLPQADPNGLFSPATADATWILCQNPTDPRQVGPHYNENRVETYLWPMKSAD